MLKHCRDYSDCSRRLFQQMIQPLHCNSSRYNLRHQTNLHVGIFQLPLVGFRLEVVVLVGQMFAIGLSTQRLLMVEALQENIMAEDTIRLCEKIKQQAVLLEVITNSPYLASYHSLYWNCQRLRCLGCLAK